MNFYIALDPANNNLNFNRVMFTFGIFSTHMPYVIMVLSYAVYFMFASPAADRLKIQGSDSNPENTEWVQDDDSSVKLIKGWDYNTVIEQEKNNLTITVSEETIFPPPDPPDKSPQAVFLPFCRPPPVFS